MIADSADIYTVETRKGLPSLKLRAEDGSMKTIHSLYDPESEAKSMVEAFQFDGKGVLVVSGLGLGYHLRELADRYPDTEMLVIEAMPEIYDLAIKHGPRVKGNIRYLIGLPAQEVIREITTCQLKKGMAPISVFALSSIVSAFPSYYDPLLLSLHRTVSVRLWEKLRYQKFRGPRLKVLLIDSGYFLLKEVKTALGRLGHDVFSVSVKKNDSGDDVISGYIEAVISSRPDFVLTINHLGLDEEGLLASFFRSIEMPVASWYVDSPRLIVQAFEKNVSPYVSMFLWDREYIEQIKGAGFESVEYLPLAADEETFRPVKLKRHVLREYQADAGFVGNSLLGQAAEKLGEVPQEHHPLVERIARQLSMKRVSFQDAVRDGNGTELEGYRDLTARQRLTFEAAVLWKATLLYRLSCVSGLRDFVHSIHGDSGWKELLDSGYRTRSPLNYYKDLPAFYNACTINLNATHLQMGHAVNQRVFDVPSCGAFLLTDYQESLDGLFEAGKEITVYNDTAEIPDLVKFYLGNPIKRESVAQRGRERVLKEHTYRHRLGTLINVMKDRYS